MKKFNKFNKVVSVGIVALLMVVAGCEGENNSNSNNNSNNNNSNENSSNSSNNSSSNSGNSGGLEVNDDGNLVVSGEEWIPCYDNNGDRITLVISSEGSKVEKALGVGGGAVDLQDLKGRTQGSAMGILRGKGFVCD